jgi:hypothetical protein
MVLLFQWMSVEGSLPCTILNIILDPLFVNL